MAEESKVLSPQKEDTLKTFWTFVHTPRKHIDYLNVAEEDFSRNRTTNVEGFDITPSSFNIMRDSLKKTSDQLHEILIQNLPDIDLESASEVSEDEDVVPLDFRTKLISNGQFVIQAKPLHVLTNEEILKEERRISA